MLTCALLCACAVVLLLQALRDWRATLGPDTPASRLPSNAAERSALKTALNNLRRGEGVDGLTMEVWVLLLYLLCGAEGCCIFCSVFAGIVTWFVVGLCVLLQ